MLKLVCSIVNSIEFVIGKIAAVIALVLTGGIGMIALTVFMEQKVPGTIARMYNLQTVEVSEDEEVEVKPKRKTSRARKATK